MKRLIGLCVLVLLTACSTPQSIDIVLQSPSENVFLANSSTTPYRIVEVTEYEIGTKQSDIELPYDTSRAGYTWLVSKVKTGSPSQLATTYRITYDLAGGILSKVKVPGSEVLIQSVPTTYQYGANVAVGSYFYARTISRYGFDCEGCGVESGGTATMASLLKVSATSIRQSDGSWKDGITYDGYYLVAADGAFPKCTILEISNHRLSGSGIQVGVPFKVLVADRGGAITTDRLDFFIGSEYNLNTVIHNGSSAGTKVTVAGFLKWKKNSLGQMACLK